MSTDSHIHDSIEQAADAVGSVWPLHSFVTANPLAGFEDRPFHEAVQAGKRLHSGEGYPDADVFRTAWETGQIDPETLRTELATHGYDDDPETLLSRMAAEGDVVETTETAEADDDPTPTDQVDRVLTKWLAVFLDQGKAHWSMPGRDDGFYAAVRRVARHDDAIPNAKRLAELPTNPVAAIETLLADYPTEQWPAVFEHHLSALPGWTGFLKQRIADDDEWQGANPITLAGYLAVRLALADLFDAPIRPPEDALTATDTDDIPLAEVWLSAWEATYREQLVDAVESASADDEADDEDSRPDAQFVFCIDTRSEVIRRHIEATGNYETHGYAGFFGIPMRYSAYDSDVTVDACPPILDAAHRIADRPTGDNDAAHHSHDRWTGLFDAGKETLESLKGNAATAFSLVETSGPGYGVALAARTLVPDRVADFLDAADERVPDKHEFCTPSVDYNPDSVNELREGLTLGEKVEYAETAFELMGWEQFGRLVVFAGHASQTTNNPFESSLDCGACAGNPGGPNARVLAAICNDDDVKAELRDHGFDVPEDTVFVAGEHNTTTDEVELYDHDVPASHEGDVEQLKSDLETARAGATAERVESDDVDADGAVRETRRRAADWAETRPEWGLAGNAGFVVGPRSLTDGLDLDGRAFLHSYDWTTDPDGDALEAIVTGPLVVTQWINNQYYFATVDNAVYGSGSKVTHNPVGNVGVYQGNGGDLMNGLPLQSLMSADDEPYHQPLRLSAVLHAPVDRVTEILADHPEVTGLLDNGWLSLTVVDPTQGHRGFHYEGELEWTPASPETVAESHLETETTPEVSAPAPTADD